MEEQDCGYSAEIIASLLESIKPNNLDTAPLRFTLLIALHQRHLHLRTYYPQKDSLKEAITSHCDKRIFDLTLSFFGLIILSPIFLFV